MGRVFANGRGDLGSIPGRIIPKTLKMVLDSSSPIFQYMLLCSAYITGLKQFKLLKRSLEVGSIVLVSVLRRCALLHLM